MLLVGRADAWIDGRPHHFDRNKFIEPCRCQRWKADGEITHGAMEVTLGVYSSSASMISARTAHVLRSPESKLCASRPSFWQSSPRNLVLVGSHLPP